MFQLARVNQYNKYPTRVLNDLRLLLTVILRVSPKLKISSLGYDLLAFARSESCMNTYRSTLRGIPIEKFRKDLIENFSNIFSTLQREFPNNFYYIPVWGTLQRKGGIPNAPNIQLSSPAKYFADCIHPNEEGWNYLMTEMFDGLKKTNYFQ
jgi:hypothetical protein